MRHTLFYVTQTPPEIPERFNQALASIRATRLRPEVHLVEVPPPTRVAPYAAALSADIYDPRNPDRELSSGRFIVMHDPAGQQVWQGDMRIVTLVRAPMDPEVSMDPLFYDGAWSWLTDSHTRARSKAGALAGTVTLNISKGYGTLADRTDEVLAEIRASWTPATTAVGLDLSVWADLLCQVAGILPLPEGITAISPRR